MPKPTQFWIPKLVAEFVPVPISLVTVATCTLAAGGNFMPSDSPPVIALSMRGSCSLNASCQGATDPELSITSKMSTLSSFFSGSDTPQPFDLSQSLATTLGCCAQPASTATHASTALA